MKETPETLDSFDQHIRDEGGVLLLLLITNPTQYTQEKNNIQNLIEPQGDIDPEELESQRMKFLTFYYPGWTLEDLQSLLSYLEEHEDDVIKLQERYTEKIEEAPEALMQLLSQSE